MGSPVGELSSVLFDRDGFWHTEIGICPCWTQQTCKYSCSRAGHINTAGSQHLQCWSYRALLQAAAKGAREHLEKGLNATSPEAVLPTTVSLAERKRQEKMGAWGDFAPEVVLVCFPAG